MMLKNEGGNGDIHLQIPKAEEGFGKPEKKNMRKFRTTGELAVLETEILGNEKGMTAESTVIP